MRTKILQEALETTTEVLEEVTELETQMARARERLSLGEGFSYPETTSLLLQAHQDLQERVESLEEDKDTLENQNTNLEADLRAAEKLSVEREGALDDGAQALREYLELLTESQVLDLIHGQFSALREVTRVVLEGVKGGYL